MCFSVSSGPGNRKCLIASMGPRLTAPPYPDDVRAKGWRFELDHERIQQSDTWALAAKDMRPWLLMLWMTAWTQTPCGSLPLEDALIAARIDMPLKTFLKCKASLMRGWALADNGRLYHPTITAMVIEMLGKKQAEKDRKAAYRLKMDGTKKPPPPPNVPPDNTGTVKGQPPDGRGGDATGTSTGTGTGTLLNTSEAKASGGKPPMQPDEIIFSYGLGLLTNAGTPEKLARSFLGGLRKQHGDPALIDGLRECARAKPLQPLEWLAAALPPAGGAPKPNAQEALEASNRAVGERFLAKDNYAAQ